MCNLQFGILYHHKFVTIFQINCPAFEGLLHDFKVIILLKQSILWSSSNFINKNIIEYPTNIRLCTVSMVYTLETIMNAIIIIVWKINFHTVLTTSLHLRPVLSHSGKGIQNHQVTFHILFSHSLGMQNMPYYVIF